jgi:hypothetical protein
VHYFDADTGENLMRESDRDTVEQMEDRTEERTERDEADDRDAPPGETRRSA